MKRVSFNKKIAIISFLSLFSILSCKRYDNFTTYFNTYYNAERLVKLSEEEFEFTSDKKRVTPRVFVPETNIKAQQNNLTGVPPFMVEFIIDQQKLQPVKIKLDSVIIKGSKILTRHPNSDFTEKTLYLMAIAYFYRNEWLPAQIKCNELVDKFFDGELSPDAHLLLAKTYLIQRKFLSGQVMLSRTVDIAWQKERYDVLSEAFRLSAELALYNNDMEKAVKPYKQAIAQSDNNDVRSKWQIDLAALFYRKNKFPEAYIEFKKALDYYPDYQGEFESYLYQSLSLMRMGNYEEANKILKDLESNSNYEEWLPYVHTARMDMTRIQADDVQYAKFERFTDSAYINHPSGLAVYFQRAVDYYKANDYTNARKYFAKTRNTKSTVYNQSERMFYYLNTWEAKRNDAKPYMERYKTGNLNNDTLKSLLSSTLFDLGRVHEQLDNKDSALLYYDYCTKISPEKDTLSARYIFALSRMTADSNLKYSDSLLEVLVEKYPRTEYGKEAMIKLGYTDKYLIDSIADLYFSANSLRNNKDFNFAMSQYTKVYTVYPDSKFAPKSLYAIGTMFEKNLNNKDSALYYYNLLISKYPRSEYAQELKLPVAYLNAIKSGKALPDSLKDRPKVTFQPSIDPYAETVKLRSQKAVWEAEKVRRETEINMENVINNPSLLLKKAKEIINDPTKAMPKMDLPIDPKDFKNKLNLDSLKLDTYIKPLLPDSTKKDKEPIKK